MSKNASYRISCSGKIARAKDISYPAKFTLERIISLSWEKGYCWAGNQELMEHIGWTNEKSFGGILAELEDAVCINRVIRDGKRFIYPLKYFDLESEDSQEIPTPPNGLLQENPTPPTGLLQKSPTPPTGLLQKSPTPPNGLPTPRPMDGAPPAQWATLPPHPSYKEEDKKRVKGGQSASACGKFTTSISTPPPPPSQKSQEQGQAPSQPGKEAAPPEPARPSLSPPPPPSFSSFSQGTRFRESKALILSEAQYENLVDRYEPLVGYDMARKYVYSQIEKFDEFLSGKPGVYRGKHFEKLVEWCDQDILKAKDSNKIEQKQVSLCNENINNLVYIVEQNKKVVQDYLFAHPEARKHVLLNSLSVTIWQPNGSSEINFGEKAFNSLFEGSIAKACVVGLPDLRSPAVGQINHLPVHSADQIKEQVARLVQKHESRHPNTKGKMFLRQDSCEFILFSGDVKQIKYNEECCENKIVKCLEEMKLYDTMG